MPADNTAIKSLVSAIKKYRESYAAGNPTISDAEYDRLEAKLAKLDPGNKTLQKVGSKAKGKVLHDPPMLSSDKVYTVKEVIEWAGDEIIVYGLKIDGLSVEIEYKKGVYDSASTRGNGEYGEDVTAAAANMKGVPRELSEKINAKVRGEAFMNVSDFEKVNAAEGGKYDSPRNLAVGTLRSKDPSLVKDRKLYFMAWDALLPGKEMHFTGKLHWMRLNHFKTADFSTIKPSEIESTFDNLSNNRNTYDLEMDGLVFKYNDAATRQRVGSTAHHPRWMIALKFPSRGGTTTLKSITWQVGRTGKITPVAEIEPIALSGATFNRVTLHNAKFVIDKKLAPGDSLDIVRSGDVIPKVTGVKNNSTKRPVIPKFCPVCESATSFDGTFLNCTGKSCGETKLQELLHFVDTVKIEGLGEVTARALWDSGAVKSAAGLYSLEKRYLVEQFGKNGEKIYENIQGALKLRLDIFLAALGIKALGKTVSKEIAKEATSLADLTPAFALKVLGNGKIGTDVSEAFAKKPWIPFVKAGVTFVKPAKTAGPAKSSKGSSLAGKSVYITGSVEGMKKEDLEAFAESKGLVWKKMSKSLDILVLANKFGAEKLKFAEETNKTAAKKILVMKWEDFVKEVGK